MTQSLCFENSRFIHRLRHFSSLCDIYINYGTTVSYLYSSIILYDDAVFRITFRLAIQSCE